MNNHFLIMSTFFKTKKLLKIKKRKKLEKYQDKKIINYINYLSNNSEYFKKFFERHAISKTPQMDRNKMLTYFGTMNTFKISKQDALSIALNSNTSDKFKDLNITLTEASCGNGLLCIVSQREYSKLLGYIFAKFLSKYHDKNKRIALFVPSQNNIKSIIPKSFSNIEVFNAHDSSQDIVYNLNRYMPHILIASEDILLGLVDSIRDCSLNISPTKIICTSSRLTKSQKEDVSRYFNIGIIHEMLLSSEGFLASTCKHGNLHLNEEIMRFEKDFIDEKNFVPIISDFERKSQAFLRYRVNGVLIETSDNKCGCGQVSEVIENLQTRKDDCLYFNSKVNNDVKYTAVFPEYITSIFLSFLEVCDYQVIQDKNFDVIIKLDKSSKTLENTLLTQFNLLFDYFNVHIPNIRFEKFEKNTEILRKCVVREFDL